MGDSQLSDGGHAIGMGAQAVAEIIGISNFGEVIARYDNVEAAPIIEHIPPCLVLSLLHGFSTIRHAAFHLCAPFCAGWFLLSP